jgi:phosphoenolpyruvate carboxylase
MDQEHTTPEALAQMLTETVAAARDRAREDPFGNPVLLVALAISRQLDRGTLDLDQVAALVRILRDRAFAARATRLGAYSHSSAGPNGAEALAALARRLARPDPLDSPVPFAEFNAACERTRFGVVFTAHPTFSAPAPVLHALAEAAGGTAPPAFVTHRPSRPTLEQEFEQAAAALHRGRDALDALSAALLREAAAIWPDRWASLVPRSVVLASWVGYDTDGRTDIGWWDTLRLRLRMKRLGLVRLAAQVGDADGDTEGKAALSARVAEAVAAVDAQLLLAPSGPDPKEVAAFAEALVGGRDAALHTPAPLLPLFDAAIADAEGDGRLQLLVARAGLVGHGMSLAHTHVRLNATQLHNAIRQRLGLSDPPGDPVRRRALLAGINAALDAVRPVPVYFGALLAEQASAVRLMMTVAQIVKHVDGASPVRFLIAETESGYTLLAALWLARLFGCDRNIEISPLFETAEALESGARVLDEALRSPHWRDYLRQTGRLCLQFGYSDSGRYVGQLDASYLIERLRMRVADALARHGVSGIEVVLFDTHGESIGRGSHPGSMTDRLRYLSPATSRQAFARAGVTVREESAFQGGDGYLHFGSPALALASIARIAEHAFADPAASGDPIYDDPDFAVDFFATIGQAMRGLVEDPGYAALLGTFGPALLDPTGSRPSARQTDSGGPVAIRHPRELRAIPNNAILQQVGWCANTVHGLGAAALRHPEPFAELRRTSSRFRRATDLAAHGLLHSDLDVLRATVAVLDPGTWLDRAAHAEVPGRREGLVAVARALERLDLWADVAAMFRRVQTDHLSLRAVWPDAPRMGDEEVLLHALRLALIQRIWLLATAIPDFSPRHGVTPQDMLDRLIRLDVPAAVALLAEVFPAAAAPGAELDYGEAAGPRSGSYGAEHKAIFDPMRRLFDLLREIGGAITHHVGAFG